MMWFRMYHDAPSHPRMKLIAHRAGTSIANTFAIWTTMLCHASRQDGDKRGTLHGWDDLECALLLGIGEEVVFCVHREMEGRLLDADRIIGWEQRQSSRDDSSERVRRWRERQREQKQQDSAAVTRYPVTVTPCNEQIREEEIREEEKSPPNPPSRKRAGRVVAADPDFAKFWTLYPRKVGKGQAERAWASATRTTAPVEITEALQVQLDVAMFDLREGGRFVPHPATWLNGKRWLDGIEAEELPLARIA